MDMGVFVLLFFGLAVTAGTPVQFVRNGEDLSAAAVIRRASDDEG